jgi:hypothetical protein
MKSNKGIWAKDDCHCGKPLKVNDPRRRINVKKTIKKRNLK